MGFIDTCHNVLITVKTITGNQNLYANGLSVPGQLRPGQSLNLGYPANVQSFYAYDVGSELSGSDAISLCATPGDSGDFTQSFRSYAQSPGVPYPHLYISVYGFNDGEYTITVQEATSALPRFNLPVSSHYFFLPALLGNGNVTCAPTGPMDATNGLLEALYADPDPAFKSLAITAGISPATYGTSSRAVAFSITLADSVLGQPRRFFWAHPANCSVDWSNTLRTATGAVRLSPLVHFACDLGTDLTVHRSCRRASRLATRWQRPRATSRACASRPAPSRAPPPHSLAPPTLPAPSARSCSPTPTPCPTTSTRVSRTWAATSSRCL